MQIDKKYISYSFYTLFLGVFVWLLLQLFFVPRTDFLFFSVKYTGPKDAELLKIIFPDEPTTLEPTVLNTATRQRDLNIFESLVGYDRDFNLRPQLAVSWGLVDNLTWEFKMRSGVVFQDGTKFDVADVKASFDRAMDGSKSELKALKDVIKDIEIVDVQTVRFHTFEPEPLLPQKAALVLIVPSEHAFEVDMPIIGTGPYSLFKWEKNDFITLSRFDSYWGDKPVFKNVAMVVQPDKVKRVETFIRGDADFLAFVPYDAASYVKKNKFKIQSIPSLEVQFLLFNMKSVVFQNSDIRKAVSMAVDRKVLVNAVGGYAKSSNQFVSSGIFGFDPSISDPKYDLESAKNHITKSGFNGRTIQFHLPIGLDILGEHVRKQFALAGLKVIVSYLDYDKLVRSMDDGVADLYFLGFKADSGDASDLFNLVVREGAQFNIGKYSIETVNKLIDESAVTLDPKKRLQLLQDVQQTIVNVYPFGVPLFEYETLYSFADNVDFTPRMDGYIYLNDIKLK